MVRVPRATVSAWRRSARSLTASMVCVALILGTFGFESPAVASAQPPLSPMTIVSENFDAVLPSRFTVGRYDIAGAIDATAWWGRITNVRRSGTHSLYCAGASPTGSQWSIYPPDTRGRFEIDLPELAEYYSADLGFYYRMSSRGANDAQSFIFQWREKSGSTYWPLDSRDRDFALTGTSWVPRSWSLTSPDGGTNLSRTAGQARLLFVDNVGSDRESPATGNGPAVDDLTVTGYKYGPVRTLTANTDTPGTVALSWQKPARATGTTTADERTLTYRVWRRPAAGGTWTELTADRLTAPGFTDATAPGGVTYTYLVQAWDPATGTGYGQHTTADADVPFVDTGGPQLTGLTSTTHPSESTWYQGTGPVTFTWTQSTDPSGVTGYSTSWSTDPGVVPNTSVDVSPASITSKTFASPVASGTWYFKIKARDGAGNWGDVATRVVRLDSTLPTGSISINSGEHYTATREVTVSSSSVQFGPSGADATGAMRFNTGSGYGAWVPFESEYNVELPNTNGTHWVYAQFRDAAGNVSTGTIGDSIVLDMSAPAITSLTSDTHTPESAWRQASDVRIAWVAEEQASGIAGYEYVFSLDPDAAPHVSVGSAVTGFAQDSVPDGEWHFRVRAQNNLGTWGPIRSRIVRIDTTKPAVEGLASSTHPSDSTWYQGTGPIEFTWTPSSDLSGIVGYSTHWSTSSSAVPDSNVDVAASSPARSIPAPVASGTWYLTVKALDGAGNWSDVASRTVRLDSTAPTVGGLASPTHPASTAWHSKGAPVTFTWNASADSHSGVSGYSVSWSSDPGVNPNTQVDVTNVASPSYTVPAGDVSQGTWYFKVRSRDAAGNWGPAVGQTVRIDTTMPTGAITINNNATHTLVRTVTVTSSMMNWGLSGAGQMRHSLDGGTTWVGGEPGWVAYSPTRSLTLPAGDGTKTVRAEFRDAAGNVSQAGTISDAIYFGPINIQGDTRYHTAIETAKRAFPAGAKTVILATGNNFPDALAAAPLAGALDAPILLVPTKLPAAGTSTARGLNDTLAYAKNELKAGKAIVLGGDLAITPAVYSRITSTFGTSNVTRIAGNTRYVTANMIIERALAEMKTVNKAWDGTAFLATGTNFPDALAAAPVSVSAGWPVYLTSTTSFTPATRDAMKKAGVKKVIVLGGELAINATAYNQVRTAFGTSNVRRIYGATRYETAAKIATEAVNLRGHTWDRVGITTGTNFPDALAGGVLQGKQSRVTLLTRSDALSADTRTTLVAQKSKIQTVTFFGGDVALNPSVRTAVRNALQ